MTLHSTHADIVCRAASAGKHVFIEKPLTLTVADARRAATASREAGVVLQVGHHRRFQGATRRVKGLIDSGELGEIYQLEANLSGPSGGSRTGWRSDPAECPAGSMTGLGVHMVENLHYLAGPVKCVSAFCSKISSVGNLDDVTNIIMEFESGTLGYVGTAYGIPKVFNTAAFGTGGNAWSEDEGKRLRKLGIDPSAVEVADLGGLRGGSDTPAETGARARLLTEAAISKLGAYDGFRPENAKMLIAWEEEMSRRSLFTLPPVRYEMIPSIRGEDCFAADGCRICSNLCPHNALAVSPEGRMILSKGRCTGCGACVSACPAGAFEFPGASLPQL